MEGEERREMKTKKYEEANYIAMGNKTLNEIKIHFKIQIILIIILVILALIICFRGMKLAIDYEALEKEKKALEDYIETQSSMISDLEENCKDLYIELENEKFGGNVE